MLSNEILVLTGIAMMARLKNYVYDIAKAADEVDKQIEKSLT
jgi:hypothetical protein